jgi:hypothetical protein
VLVRRHGHGRRLLLPVVVVVIRRRRPPVVVAAGGGAAVVGGDEEHVLDAAAEGGDLGLERAQAERLERADEVRQQVGAVVAAERRAHDEAAVLVAGRVDGELVGLGGELARLLRDLRRLPLQLLDVLDHLRQQRRLVCLQHACMIDPKTAMRTERGRGGVNRKENKTKLNRKTRSMAGPACTSSSCQNDERAGEVCGVRTHAGQKGGHACRGAYDMHACFRPSVGLFTHRHRPPPTSWSSATHRLVSLLRC